MKKIIFALALIGGLCGQAFANTDISKTLMEEWTRFRAKVETITPQGEVGGYMLFRDYGDMKLLWRTSANEADNEVIRFFMKRSNGDVFAVTYHKSKNIIPNKLVVRRFIGTEPVGWVNHTIDYTTGEYLGSQGEAIMLTPAEKKILSEWGITEF